MMMNDDVLVFDVLFIYLGRWVLIHVVFYQK